MAATNVSQFGEDIHDVVDDLVVKGTRIVDHLRDHGQNEEANRVSRDLTSVFRYIYEVIQPYGPAQSMLKPGSPDRLHSHISHENTQIQSKGYVEHSWASVAATPPVKSTRLIKYTPEDSGKHIVTEEQIAEPRALSDERRVVWIQPWADDRPVSEISKSLGGLGALFSIAFAPEDRAVCLIFQYAHGALGFLRDHEEYVGRHGQSRFGPDITIMPGHPFPVNDDLRRMEIPFNERRRLTFARSQLFSNGMTEKRFTTDLETIVGAINIELIWLFNTGNATAVFSAVPLARLVRERFRQMSRTRGSPYEGIMISYSHDPSEKELRLVTQMQDGTSNGHHAGRSMNSICGAKAPSRRESNASMTSNNRYRRGGEKSHIDSDGWQTVGKKR